MKKVISMASAVLTLGLAVATAHADCGKFQCADVKVVAMFTRDNGDALIQLSGKPWQLGCKPTRYVYVTLPAATQDFQNLYAHLAAYQIMDKTLSVNIDAGTKECTIESFAATN